MSKDRRIDFIRKWFKRGSNAKDPFEQFFCLWISLVVAAQRLRTFSGVFHEDDTDAKKIYDYCQSNQQKIAEVLARLPDQMNRLARRHGTTYHNAIVDTRNPELRNHFQQLSEHYVKGARLSDGELVQYAAELINKIRNNVFHGVKVYDDREDLELLNLINPVLRAVVESCETVAG